MLEIGSVLDGKYKILSEIGHGGMSVVYLALNEKANKTWAVKEVRKGGGNDSEIVSQGLVAETEMLKKLSHPNLPSIVDVIDGKDSFIIVMDYIEGQSLQSILNQNGQQDPELVLQWTQQLCDVLGYLHSRKPPIIYRDMKPANVMLQPNGQVALIDFGTAREYKEHRLEDTTWLGTRGYAAPEQFGGRGQTDARTDIYCLGATMYHLLTGYSPADTQFVIHPVGQLRPELAGSGIEKIVAKCCQPDPKDRYQDCAEMMYDLEHAHEDDDRALHAREKRWRAFLLSCAVTVLGVVGLISFAALQKRQVLHSYSSYISMAKNSQSYEEAAEAYKNAMRLQADSREAYDGLLDEAVSANGEAGTVITADEKRILEEALMDSSGVNGNMTNLDYFRLNNPEEYAQFQFRRGVNYFATFEGGCSAAYYCLESVKDDEHLGSVDRNVAKCLFTLTDIYRRQGEENAGWVNTSTVGLVDYRELWENFIAIAGDIATVDEQTGETRYAVAIYREIATQIHKRPEAYRNADVSDWEMLSLLNNAEAYLAMHSDDENLPTELKEQAVRAVSQAKEMLEHQAGGRAAEAGASAGDDGIDAGQTEDEG